MTEEKKESKSTDEHINLKVLGQDNNVVQFKIKKGTPLRKLMNAYCERCNLSVSTVRFRFDGQPINEQDTPSSLEMEEGDTIEIYQQQTGGGHRFSLQIDKGPPPRTPTAIFSFLENISTVPSS